MWVDRVIYSTSDPVTGVVRLVLHLFDNMDAWTAAPDEALNQVQLQISQLHRRARTKGGATLLQAIKLVGEQLLARAIDLPAADADRVSEQSAHQRAVGTMADFLESEPWAWLRASVSKHLQERCNDQLQSAVKAKEVLDLISNEAFIPHELSEQVLCLLLTQLSAPTEGREDLMVHLLSIDESRFWQPLLTASGTNQRLRDHPMHMKVREAVHGFGQQLLERAVHVDVVLEILTQTARSDHHALLCKYFEALSLPLTSKDVNALLSQAIDLQNTLEALTYFLTRCCAEAEDREAVLPELQRASALGLEMRVAGTEAFWGDILPPFMRDAAAAIFQLRGSQLFQTEWTRAQEAAAGDGALTVAQLARDVFGVAREAFETDCTRLLTDQEVSLRDVAHITGDETFDVELELRLMFPNETGREQQERLLQLKQRLESFAQMVHTLRDAQALQGLVRNLCVESDDETELQNLAAQLLSMGAQQEQHTLQRFSECTIRFYTILQPLDEAIAACSALGEYAASDLFAFLRELDDDLRDLVDSGEDNGDLVDVTTSLLKLHAVLKPILLAPSVLHGSEDSTLEMLTQQLLQNAVSGRELAAQVAACCNNLYRLRSMYANLTEKGEQTKETIQLIVRSGCWVFEVKQSVTGAICDMHVEFENDMAGRHNRSAVNDLRSRALLEVNSIKQAEEAPERPSFLTFLELVKKAESISTSLTQLLELGHLDAYSFDAQQAKRLHELSELQEWDEELDTMCTEWRATIAAVRGEYYLTSFFSSVQLWQLHQLLCGGEAIPMVASTAWRELLDYVTPSHRVALQVALDAEHGSAEDRLRQLGEALHQHFKGLEVKQRMPVAWQGRKLKLVRDGEPTLCFVRAAPGRSNMLESCLALYEADGELPEHPLLLFCSNSTTRVDIDAVCLCSFWSPHSHCSHLAR